MVTNPPNDILKACAHVYSTCATYADKGAVRSQYADSEGVLKWEDQIRFRTAFVRPDRFRFEFLSKMPYDKNADRILIWYGGKEAKWWWSLEPDKIDTEEFSMAIAWGTGVSHGTAHTIPTLLLPELTGGDTITTYEHLSLLQDDVIGGVECFRISHRETFTVEYDEEEIRAYVAEAGKLPNPTMTIDDVYWIEKNSFLIRRIDDLRRGPSISRTDYQPRLNETVSEEQLVFDPRMP